MVTEVSPEQRKKAYSLMAVTELGMIVLLQPTINLFVDVSIIALQLSRESYVPLFLSTVTEVRLEQPEKALSPIEVTELGMVTEVSLEQSSKACSPMEVTELGIITEVSPEQPRKALPPMEVTELGMVTEVSPEQPWKARLPIEVTEYVVPL